MKHLILLIALISLSSCKGQKIDQKPLYKQVASVSDIIGERAILSAGKYSNYNVPADSLQKFKEYVFYLEITDCGECTTKQAIVIDWAYTTGQIQRDQAANAKKYKNRKVINK